MKVLVYPSWLILRGANFINRTKTGRYSSHNGNIEVISFKRSDYAYPQMWGDFIANLSVLDMMFNCGPKAREIILASA